MVPCFVSDFASATGTSIRGRRSTRIFLLQAGTVILLFQRGPAGGQPRKSIKQESQEVAMGLQQNKLKSHIRHR
jgi:hypothetical protein